MAAFAVDVMSFSKALKFTSMLLPSMRQVFNISRSFYSNELSCGSGAGASLFASTHQCVQKDRSATKTRLRRSVA